MNAKILNSYKYSYLCNIENEAAGAANLCMIFNKHDNGYTGFNPEAISNDLYRLNMEAYNGRYHEGSDSLFHDPIKGINYSLRPMASAGNGPQEWHYHLASLIDCYLYQTAEDATNDDPMRKALETFQTHLMHGIVSHSEQYKKFRWGE